MQCSSAVQCSAYLIHRATQLDSDGGLRDITDLLRPSLGREPGQPRTARVKRANSNPEIEVNTRLLSPQHLDGIGTGPTQ